MRKLKNSGSSEAELKDAISELLRLKQELQNDESESSDDVSLYICFPLVTSSYRPINNIVKHQ